MWRNLRENIYHKFFLTSPACLVRLGWFVRWEVSKVATLVEGDPKAPFFNSYYTKVYRRALILSLDYSTLPYHIMLSVKQGGIKYHFLVFGMTRLGDWTQVSQNIGEHSSELANGTCNLVKTTEWNKKKAKRWPNIWILPENCKCYGIWASRLCQL